MQIVPSTLHHQVKFIYNNKMYTLHADNNLQACLQTSFDSSYSSHSSNSSTQDKTLTPPKDTSLSEEVLLNDDRESLNFTPSFIGEYKTLQSSLSLKRMMM